jgi:hypothetical protein
VTQAWPTLGESPGSAALGRVPVKIVEPRHVCLVCQMDGHFASLR